MIDFLIWYLSGFIIGNLLLFLTIYFFNKGVEDGGPIKIHIKVSTILAGIFFPLLGFIYIAFALISLFTCVCIYLHETGKLKNLNVTIKTLKFK